MVYLRVLCLGPRLVIVYLNDFENCLKFSQTSIYADDANVTIASDDVEKLIFFILIVNQTYWQKYNLLYMHHDAVGTDIKSSGPNYHLK